MQHPGVEQHVPVQHVPVQHVVPPLVQHVGVPFVQHVGLETVQHPGVVVDPLAEDSVGTGQHEM